MIIKLNISEKGGIFTKRPNDIILQSMKSAMREVTSFLEREVKIRTPVGFHGNRGAGLKSSIFGEAIFRGKKLVRGIVSHSFEYGLVIEEGRKPGGKMPPKGTLVDWITFKFAGVDEAEAIDLEWIVRKNIAKFGFEGAHMFKEAYEENEAKVFRIFGNAGLKITKEMGETV